ncbi:hypothetical protein E4N87_03915 [Treponema denticola]|uniref:Pyrimidine dimer DNA glycosylase n=1 Tax=Treponema denticola TaxID=158 RepID=A0A9Q9BKQ7_TREDN|nr:TIGR02328 family protein [Treponema denticola]UTC89887.1 hypothetical protein E4N87_03915 [Treponema denticola]UTD00762.1 hypothetical protein E4N86_08665 [Treponema denticola]
MRLWHQNLINRLPAQQLLGQHRECCALRGNGWGKKHSVVDYVFLYSPYKLFQYHELVMEEMNKRGYKVSEEWLDKNYRGKKCHPYADLKKIKKTSPIYKEHDEKYMQECITNLREKI